MRKPQVAWEYAREFTKKLDEERAGWGAEQGWREFGLDGWELVSIYAPLKSEGGPIAVFKRPLSPKVTP